MQVKVTNECHYNPSCTHRNLTSWYIPNCLKTGPVLRRNLPTVSNVQSLCYELWTSLHIHLWKSRCTFRTPSACSRSDDSASFEPAIPIKSGVNNSTHVFFYTFPGTIYLRSKWAKQVQHCVHAFISFCFI